MVSIINLEWRIATYFCCFLPSNLREQRSGIGILGIAAHRMLVSHPLCRLLVSFAGTKHCCLTAVNRDGALCCPDFPRDRGLKPRLFFPYPAMNRHAILLVVMYASRRLCFAFRTIEACFVFLVFYREPRGLEVRGAIAIASMTLQASFMRQAHLSSSPKLMLLLPSNLPRVS